MRDLAHRLLVYEAGAATSSEPAESATLRVYEKLRMGLVEFAGVAGFQALATRALALARSETPSLSSVRISADGTLHGLGDSTDKFENPIDRYKNQAAEGAVSEAGVLLISRLLGLLHIFLGEALTLSLRRVTWPGAAFDDRSSENGRQS